MTGGPVPLRRRILVVKHGALGDFVLATGPMRAIRAHHLADRIVLLTTPPLAAFAEASGLFDEVWHDPRPGPFDVRAWRNLIRRLRRGSFHRVYDLQTSDRSSLYLRFFPRPRPEWSGIAAGASHRHRNPDRIRMHTLDRQTEQLALAGVGHVPPPDLSWATADIRRFPLRRPYGLLVAGGSGHRAAKRWPPTQFAALARRMTDAGMQPVAVGGAGDRAAAAESVGTGALDLTGRTSLMELAEVARHAAVAVGNDTGPMHVAAVTGCLTVVLFSAASDPALCAPRGARVCVLRQDDLADLAVEAVAAEMLRGAGGRPRHAP